MSKINVSKGEPLLPIPVAVERATGFRPSPSTVWRWKLRDPLPIPFVTVGGRDLSSVEAIHRWNEASTAHKSGTPAAGRPGRERDRDIARADAELKDLGV